MISLAQFTSANPATIASVSLGFTPEALVLIEAHGATNPNIRIWANNARFSEWAAALALLITGSTGVVTRDTASVIAYAGGDVVTSDDVTAKRYFKRDGSLYAAGDITEAGITIPAGDQTSAGANLILAFRNDI